MKFKRLILLITLTIGLNGLYCQNSIGVKIDHNVPRKWLKGKKGISSDFGFGVSYIRKDIKERFINYELAAGFDFGNVTVKDMYNNPPSFLDFNRVYTHKINSLNLNVVISAKKRIIIRGRYTPYFGIGITPTCFLISKAKVYSGSTLLKKSEGFRLADGGDRFKIYDLFYVGVEYKKRIDFRLNMQGLIFNKIIGTNDFYYYNTEHFVNYTQYSFQIIINLYK